MRSKAQNKAGTDHRSQRILGNCVSGEMEEVHRPPKGDVNCHSERRKLETLHNCAHLWMSRIVQLEEEF